MSVQKFFPLVAGQTPEKDWFQGKVPANIEVGENTVFDSSFCFKHYFSRLPVGMRVGRDVTLWRTSIAVEEEGYLELGDECYVANANLVSSRSIRVGSRCFIAGGVTIADSDFHPIDPAARLADTIALSSRGDRRNRPEVACAEVVVGDDVWIGWNASIMKGVTIGDGAVVAPGALVVKSVPAGAWVSGNPAAVRERSSDGG
jgi:acetyltransferase-like isoleucine patch superfamily enzyme